uniref:Uncharacterized protein n=1 Tax=Acrobeloides nanus TaxID=290746 RepID=A0A914CDC9_9BILA
MTHFSWVFTILFLYFVQLDRVTTQETNFYDTTINEASENHEITTANSEPKETGVAKVDSTTVFNNPGSSNSETTFNGGPFDSSIAPISDLPDTKTSVNERVQDPSTLGSGQPVTTLNGRETGGSTAQIDEATGSGTNTNEEYSIATLESSTILPF